MSFVDISVRGLNRALLFNKLKKVGIKVLCVKSPSEKELTLRVKAEDAPKAFAILKNMWYTEKKGYGGAKGLFERLKNDIALFLAFVFLFAACFFLNGFAFNVDASAFPPDVERDIRALVEKDFKPWIKIDAERETEIERLVMKNIPEVENVNVKKLGNTLVIDGICAKKRTLSFLEQEKLYSLYTGVIEEITVFKGTALKTAGDEVYFGELIAEGGVVATYSVRCEGTYEALGDGSEEFLAKTELAATLFFPYSSIVKKEKEKRGDKTAYRVTVSYVSSYPGGIG